MEQLKRLLVRYADMFSIGNLDLGCTNPVEHCTDIGNHQPMKQAPRRITPVRHQKIEKVMENLCWQRIIERPATHEHLLRY